MCIHGIYRVRVPPTRLVPCGTLSISNNYRHRPSYDPDSFVSVDQLSKIHDDEAPVSIPSTPHILPLPPWPWVKASGG